MTGKQCIFSSQVQDTFSANAQCKDSSSLEYKRAFVIMPKRPNFEAFYQWSLKPFLDQDCKIKSVQIADEVRDIGYIICEKICRKIQESDFVLADISLPNANVFYEIGLAFGLKRPIVLMENKFDFNHKIDSNQKEQNKSILDSPSSKGTFSYFSTNKILSYEGVMPLDFKKSIERLKACITEFSDDFKKKDFKFKIRILSFSDDERNVELDKKNETEDLMFGFKKLVCGAIAKAMSEIKNEINRKKDLKSPEMKPWEQFIINMKNHEWEGFTEAESIIEENSTGLSTKIIAEKIEESFCTLIDITDNDPAAYFWLGYCHARGLNAIPVNQISENECNRSKSKLAFDIRALWYAEYDHSNLINFKNQIREIIEHLMERDLSDLHRRTFWERFPAETSLKVFVGAIPWPMQRREVVGDWDVRVVSDLFSYLPSVREATTMRLVAPLYSPEESYEKQENKPSDENFLDDFCKELENHLSNSSAIVIASPDVNPLTEYLLHKIYKLDNLCKPLTECPRASFKGYIAVKRLHADNIKDQSYTKVFPRLFYKCELLKEGEDAERGFKEHFKLADQKPIYEKYFNQDEISENGFDLLGHLLISKYPPNKESKNYVVILNGVSGPATSALAEILTGGGLHADESKRLKSEEMLKKINHTLAGDNVVGVEAIVKVHIDTPQLAEMTFADTRIIESWDFLKDYGPEEIKDLGQREEASH
jgi:nucleoside 2-deoxyribosyltransferase